MGAEFAHREDSVQGSEQLSAELRALWDENAALKQSEALLRAVMDAIADPVYAKDQQGRYVLVNAVTARLLNRTVAEVLGRDDLDLMPPDIAHQMMAGDREVMCNEGVRSFEQVLPFADVTRTYLTVKAPYRDEQGRVIGVVGSSRDITERRQSEVALKQSEALLADSQQLAHVGSWSRDVSSGVLNWSDEQYRIFGLVPGAIAMTFERFMSLVHPGDRALIMAKVEHAVRSGQSFEVCYRIVHEDGTERVVQAQGQPVFDGTSKVVRMYGSAQDITERKLAEETLRASEQQFRAVFEGSLDAMVLADDDGRYVNANPAACRLFGVPLDDLLDRRLSDFTEPAFDAESAWSEFRRQGSGKGRIRLVRPDGSHCEAEYTAKSDVLPGRHLWVVRDVSEQRRAEESLRRSERRAVTILESITDAFFAVDRDWRIIYVNPQAGPLLGKAPADLLGANVWEEFPEALDAFFEHRCRRAVNDRVAISFEEYYPPPRGKWFNVHAYPSADGLSIYFSDVTERKRAEGALQRYADRLAMLHATDRAILAAGSPVQIAEAALERLRRIVPMWQGSIIIFDHQTHEELVFAATGAISERFPAGARLPLEECWAPDQEALREERAFVVDDVGLTDAPEGVLINLAALGVRSYARVPLTTEGQLLGSLNLYSDQPSAFNREHVEVAREVADSLAIAIKQAELFEDVRTGRERLTDLSRRLLWAEEAERRRIAGELHDEIGQALSALKLNFRAIKSDTGSAISAGRIDDCITLVERTIEQVRGLALDLRPALLDDLGLVPALRSHVAGMARRSDIDVSFDADDQIERHDPDIETACYRIAQEALANVARHSGASTVMVALEQSGQTLRLVVADDGTGFDVTAATTRAAAGASLGLLGMRERASLVGGHVAIISGPGSGTEVRATLPMRPEAAKPRGA
jgi:PAS domain S-box-containing protein